MEMFCCQTACPVRVIIRFHAAPPALPHAHYSISDFSSGCPLWSVCNGVWRIGETWYAVQEQFAVQESGKIEILPDSRLQLEEPPCGGMDAALRFRQLQVPLRRQEREGVANSFFLCKSQGLVIIFTAIADKMSVRR